MLLRSSRYFLLPSVVIPVQKCRQASARCTKYQQKHLLVFLLLAHRCVPMDLRPSAGQDSPNWAEGSGQAAVLFTSLQPKLATTAPALVPAPDPSQ